MDLILWRHAQAEALALNQDILNDAQSGRDIAVAIDPSQDLARALTQRGHRQAAKMAGWLNERLPESTRILVSPAQRTQQTALALGRSFKTVKAIHPGGTVDALLKAAKWPHSDEPVLIVGHQPTLGIVAARLMTGYDFAWSVKKGAVWWLRLRHRDDAAQVTLQAVQSPDGL